MTGEITYDYRDLEDRLVYQVVRKPKGDSKTFLQRRRVDSDWVWNLDGVTPIPYRWPELDLALDELADWAWVVEGEKDADRLAQHGLIATTSAKGAAWEWPAEWAEHFRGFERVVVIADNDDIGLKAARQRAAVIATAVHDVRVIDRMPNVPDKGDVSDWLDDGGTVEELYKLGEYAPQFQLAREMPAAGEGEPYDDRGAPSQEEPAPIRPLDVVWVEDAIDDPPEEPPVLIDGFLRAGELAVIVAPRKIGKSWTAFNIALLLAAGMGKLFGKLTVRKACKVLIAQGELDRYGSASRWSYLTGNDNPEEIGVAGSPPVRMIAESFERWRLRTVRKTVTGVDTRGRSMREEFFEATMDPRLEETIVEHGIDVLIIDPWAVFFAGSENNNDEVEAALGQLRALAERTGVAIVIVHHISKVGEVREPEDLWRGASRLADWASTGLTMLPHYKQEKGKGGWGSIEGMTRQKARRFVDLHFMRRSTPTEDFSIEWNPRNGWWEQWEPTIRKDSDTAQDAVRLIDEAASAVNAAGGFASTRDASRSIGWSNEKVARVFGQAAAAGLIRKDASGKATAWFPKVTSLFDDAPPHDDSHFQPDDDTYEEF